MVVCSVRQVLFRGGYLLQDWDYGRVSLLEEVQHHQGVGVGGQASPRRIPNIAHLQTSVTVTTHTHAHVTMSKYTCARYYDYQCIRTMEMQYLT